MKRLKARMEEELKNREDKIKELMKIINEKDNEITQTKNELEDSRKTQDELQKISDELLMKNEEMSHELIQKQNEITTAQNEIKKQENQISEQKEVIQNHEEELRARVEEEQKKNEEMKKESPNETKIEPQTLKETSTDPDYVEKTMPYEPTVNMTPQEKLEASKKLEELNKTSPDIIMKDKVEEPKKPPIPVGLDPDRLDEINELFTLPLHAFSIDFDAYNDDEKDYIEKLLPDYLRERLSETDISQHLTIDFDLGDRWVRYNLGKPNILDKVLDFIKNGNNLALALDENAIPKDYSYQNEFCLPPFSIIHKLQFRQTNRSWDNQDEQVKSKEDRSGAFLEYLLPDYITPEFEELMLKYQVFKTLNEGNGNSIRKELDDNCFIYALKEANFPNDILDQMRLRVRTRYISKKAIYQLCQEAKIGVSITFPSEATTEKGKRLKLKKAEKIEKGKRTTNIGYEGEDQIGFINLTCINHHFFIYDQKLPISTYYIKNMKNINEYCIKNNKNIKDWGFKVVSKNHDRYKIDSRTSSSSFNILNTLFETNQMVPIKYTDLGVMTSDIYKCIKTDFTLENFNEDECCIPLRDDKENKLKENKISHTYWYADFECSTVNDQGFPLRNHKPYCVSYSQRGSKKIYNIWGYNCIREFLELLPNESVVYFHNLGYDGRLLAPYGVKKSIIKGTHMYSLDLLYNGKNIHFKDSLALLQAPLSNFPKMFGLKEIEKEAMPYNFYTDKVIKDPKNCVIEGCWNNEVKKWDEDKIEQFKKNIDISGARVDDEHFNARKYAAFYCNRDVQLLKRGFEVFREKCVNSFHLDPDKYLTASSLADSFFQTNIYCPNGKMYLYSGVLRDYIRGSAYGGRCMCCENKSYHVKKDLFDLDACSLYPSAMCRLWTVEGKPSMMTTEMKDIKYLIEHSFTDTQFEKSEERFISAYVVDIEITKIGKERKFPLIMKKEKGININCNECITMRVDNIALEDLVTFQQIEGKILNGIYWTGNRDYRCQKIIHDAYTERAKLKKEGNPLEQVYKLILNSGYGKCIQKAIDKDIRWMKQGKELDKFLYKNYYKVDKTYSVENSKIWGVEMTKQIDTFANNALYGVQVLSMSKRIMNEVMCLAEDIGCHMYYQDTDSIHIECKDLEKLERAFMEKYKRPLVGKDTGQFHPDFPMIGSESMPISVESYFLGKKMYCDKLVDKDGNIGYHLRMKGIPNDTLWSVIKSKYNNEPLKLYEDIFNDNKVTFDLCENRVQFKMDKSMNIHSLDHFYRTITRPEGYDKVNEC